MFYRDAGSLAGLDMIVRTSVMEPIYNNGEQT